MELGDLYERTFDQTTQKLYIHIILFSSHQYKSEARMTSSGKKMMIPCLEDKYDGGEMPSIMPPDNMSMVSSNEQESGSKSICFLSQESIETLTELMEQLSKVFLIPENVFLLFLLSGMM